MTDIDHLTDEGELVWESAGTEEPGDQNAASQAGGPHSYWSLGPDYGDRWGVELIVRNCDLDELVDHGLHIGHFTSEEAAKRAAQQAERHPELFTAYRCDH